MTAFDDFLGRLNPSLSGKIKTGDEVSVERLPLISKRLTKDLGGGVVKGRIARFWGVASSGKTAMLLQSVAQWQKQGLVCSLIDIEGTFDAEWAERLGVNTKELIVEQASLSSSKIEDAITPLLKAGVDVMIIDSISMIMPEVFVGVDGELNSQDDRKQIGSKAVAIKKLLAGIHYHNEKTAVLLISQVMNKFGSMHPEQIPDGGYATEFALTQDVKLFASKTMNNQIQEEIYEGGRLITRPVGREVTYIVVKNKAGAPNGSGDFDFYYAGPDVGVDVCKELLMIAVEYGIVENKKGSSWFKYNGDTIQGKKNFVYRLKSEPDFKEQLEKDVEEFENGSK